MQPYSVGMDIVTIDLPRAERSLGSVPGDKPQEYQSRTLSSHDRRRLIYLPKFPTETTGVDNPLLLANVSDNHLTTYELLRRQSGAYRIEGSKTLSSYDFSSMDEYCLSQEDAEKMARRLQVDLSIIVFNAIEFRSNCYLFAHLHESYRRNVLELPFVPLKGPQLQSKQMVEALEFFLQMDVDVFYMKTCSFRGAQPPSNIEGLFSGSNEPEARYSMQPCKNLSCLCCHPHNQSKKSQLWPVVDFTSSATHRFSNGYTSYLNCPATCNTKNIVYAMTCPCGEYEYVDSTSQTLTDVMTYHRDNGNQIVHEKLTGSPLYRAGLFDPDEKRRDIMRRMRLYQHSARCPVALRTFLDCNPDYWCFIPMRWQIAEDHNLKAIRETSEGISSITSIMRINAYSSYLLDDYVDRVPLAPTRYSYSYRQRKQQQVFFENLTSLPRRQTPYSTIDLYQFSIITLLPNKSSVIQQFMIKQLFAIYGETKLSMICPIGNGPERHYGRPFQLDWCRSLYHPSTANKAVTQQQHSKD